MRPTVSQYAVALQELAAGAPREKVAGIAENLSGFLKRRGEEKKLGAIVKHLEKLQADQEGRVSITVVTAHPVAGDTKNMLAAKVRELFPDKKAELSYEIDTRSIGGALLRTDEMLYDATIAAELRALRKSLLTA